MLKKEEKVKETKLLDFYKNSKSVLSTLCNHLRKTPTQSQFARCCHPRFMVDYQSSSKSFPIGSFRSQYQVDIEQISSSQVVNIPSFYKLLYINKDIASFHDYNLDETCLEDLLLPYLKSCPCFPQLTKIIKFMMALLHGQSAAETRVSANKNLLVENLHKKSI